MLLKFPAKFTLWLNKCGYRTASKYALKPKFQLHVPKQTAAKERNSIIYTLRLALSGPHRVSVGEISAPRTVTHNSYNKAAPHDAITSTSSWRRVTNSIGVDMGPKMAGTGVWATISVVGFGFGLFSLFVWFLFKHYDWKDWKFWEFRKGDDRCEQCGGQMKE